MSNDPTGGPGRPATPIYDETVDAIAVERPQHDEGSSSSTADRARQQAADSAGQAKDTARETAGVAKDQAQQVASGAKDAGSRVAATTKDQASRVASDAAGQARELYGQATSQLNDQASQQQTRAASALHSLGQDLGRMHENSEGGLAAELVENLSRRASRAASWLEDREPADVLDEVRQLAARRPGLFIGLAAVAGIVAARATKALVADAKPDPGVATDRTRTPGTTASTVQDSSVVRDAGTPADDLGTYR